MFQFADSSHGPLQFNKSCATSFLLKYFSVYFFPHVIPCDSDGFAFGGAAQGFQTLMGEEVPAATETLSPFPIKASFAPEMPLD